MTQDILMERYEIDNDGLAKQQRKPTERKPTERAPPQPAVAPNPVPPIQLKSTKSPDSAKKRLQERLASLSLPEKSRQVSVLSTPFGHQTQLKQSGLGDASPKRPTQGYDFSSDEEIDQARKRLPLRYDSIVQD